jgi:hypothetical protein
MLLLDFLRAPELLLLEPLQRACDKAVFEFNGVILTACRGQRRVGRGGAGLTGGADATDSADNSVSTKPRSWARAASSASASVAISGPAVKCLWRKIQ